MNWLDFAVIVLYMLVVAAIGFWTMRSIRNREDFFMGGRRYGKAFSLFMMFGTGTSSDMPVSVARESFRNGMSGIWAVLLWLFLNPLYWIIGPWFRRLRLVTIGDFFSERFQCKTLGAAYAIFSIFYFMYYIAIGLTAVGKTVEALTPRAESTYTVEEKRSVELFLRYKELGKAHLEVGRLNEQQEKEYKSLEDKFLRGELRSEYSYISSHAVIQITALVILIYSIMGGLKAAAINDFIQGILIIILSFILIPFGLNAVGWFSGLHQRVPETMFYILGSPQTSDYTVFFIFSIILINLVGIVVQPHMIQVGGGAARDEMSARIGMCYGHYLKRICTIGWALVGVLGYALYAREVSDPDMIWGYVTLQLLPAGLVGLMIVGMLAAIMSSAASFMVSGSALFTMNLYRPLRPGSSDSHLVWVGRLTTAIILVGAVLVSQIFHSVIVLLKYLWTLPVIFGSSFWLSYLWRRVTKKAAWSAVVFSFLVSFLLPLVMTRIEGVATSPRLLSMTEPSAVEVRVEANDIDVAAGLASRTGELITKEHRIPSVPIYFENKIQIHPGDPDSGFRGIGKFRVWVWLYTKLGKDFSRATRSNLDATVFVSDALTPFLVLLIVSLLSIPVSKTALDRFYARIHTPVQKDRAADKREVELSYANPGRFCSSLLFPGTNWEIMKPDLTDILGFLLAVVVALAIVGLVFLTAWIRWP